MKLNFLSLKTVTIAGLISVYSFTASAQAPGAGAAANEALGLAGVSAAEGEVVANTNKGPCGMGSTLSCVVMGLSIAQMGLSLVNMLGSKNSKAAFDGYKLNGAGVDGSIPGSTTAVGTSPGTLGYDGSNGSNGKNGAGNSAGGAATLTGAVGELSKEYSKLQEAATKAGLTIAEDGSGVTTKNGKKFSAADVGSKAAMQAAGFGPSEISEYENAMKGINSKVEARLKNLTALTNDGGGGKTAGSDHGGGGGGGGGGSDPYGAGGAGKDGRLNAKGPNIAGMSKKLGDDNIGVAGDDIFQMITRRYQARDKADNFIKDP